MASAAFKKGDKEFEWFTEFWKIVQKFWISELDNHDYWTELIEFCGTFCDKYKGDPKMRHFTLRMMMAYTNFLDEQARGDIPD